MSNLPKYGLIGKKLGHSYSEKIHNILGNNQYKKLELDEKELDHLLKSKDFFGYNITIPYKKTVIPYCDILGEEAKSAESINTVINRNGIIIGENTDLFGFEYMLKRESISLFDKNLLILGTGGTSQTASLAAKRAKASKISFASREVITKGDFTAFSDTEIIINTTPVGMFPNFNSSPVDLRSFPKCVGVVDVVYNPLYTNLLLQAKELKIKYAGGLSMLVAQAVKADALFFDKDIGDGEDIEKIIRKIELENSNIILIGMSGSGKTTLGEAAAVMTGRKFCDTDSEIEQFTGKSIPKIFADEGEREFRRIESGVISEASYLSGAVIAVGGGAVLDYNNYIALKRNGIVIWLDRGAETTAIEGRPLTPDRESAISLYEERKPIYKALADIHIKIKDKDLSKSLGELLKTI